MGRFVALGKFGCGLSFILLSLSVSGARAAAEVDPCRLVKIATLGMQLSPSGRPIVEVGVNGTPRKFLVDTAGVYSAVSARVADELGLKPKRMKSVTLYDIRGGEMSKYVEADLTIGISTAKKAALVYRDREDDEFDGILSPDYLANFDLDFDFKKGELNLISPQHCEGKVVYWTSEYPVVPFETSYDDAHITIPVKLNGRDIDAFVDTGASDTVLSSIIAAQRLDVREDTPGAELPAEKGAMKFRYRFQTLSFEGVTVKNPLIYVRDREFERVMDKKLDPKARMDPITRDELPKLDMVVGMNVLSRLRLYIAYKERKLYLSAGGITATEAQAQTP